METLTEREVTTWCEEMCIGDEKSFALCGKFFHASDDEILQIVNELPGVTHAKVVDRRGDEDTPFPAALIGTDKILEREYFASAIAVPPEHGRQWKIIWPMRPAVIGQQDPNTKHRMTSRCLPPTPLSARSEETPASADMLVAAMERLVSQFTKIQPESSYRRLRTFSGITPTPAGEEGYDTWRDVSLQYLQEWQCTDAVKKQRIVESLKGPAMEVVQAAWRSDPNATFQDYMAALEDAFGTPEDATDLLYKLRTTYQEPGEKLSDYLYRLDKLVHRIVSKGGLSSQDVDRYRLDQVLRGALTNDPTAQRLRCCDKEKVPPSFHLLLKEVRQEEAIMAAREQTSKRVFAATLKAEQSREEELLKIIEKQAEQISQLIKSHTKEVERLKQVPTTSHERQPRSTRSTSQDRQRDGDRKTEGCYVCGDPSHVARRCPNRWSPKKSLSHYENKLSGNGEGGQ
ncbi:paraneoplastic antigen Ma1 homolog [Engystomops pustulosus]|uniref:paraneoplastic antigen Ma1 homolog n=1 Tax=Engystomops pustulosus TaxID=76066 RepID=UPI003AFA2823